MEEEKPTQKLKLEKREEIIANLVRQEYQKGLRNLFIGGVILLVAWIVLNSVLPYGWVMAIVNITFLLASLIWGWFLSVAFNLVLPHWLSFILSLLVWALLFLGIRSLF